MTRARAALRLPDDLLARVATLSLAFLLGHLVAVAVVVVVVDGPFVPRLAAAATHVALVPLAVAALRRQRLGPLDVPVGVLAVGANAYLFGLGSLAVVGVAFMLATYRSLFMSLRGALASGAATWVALVAAILARPADPGLLPPDLLGPLAGLLFITAVMNTLARTLRARGELEAALRHLAFHDPLTGLPNRTLLGERLDHALAAAADGPPAALLVIDLDGFKRFNDTLGHHAGDELLVAVGGRLTAAVGADATVARMGGDEFAVVLPGADAAAAAAVADRLHAALVPECPLAGGAVRVRASVGHAAAPDDGTDADALLRCADARMYRAKQAAAGAVTALAA